MLKLNLRTLLTGLFLLSIALGRPSEAQADASATIEALEGKVSLHRSGTAPGVWQPATEADKLYSGDSIMSHEQSSCVLVFSDEARLTVQPNTTFTLQETPDSKDILLETGNLRAQVNKANVTKPFQVVTPPAVAAVRGTDVYFSLTEEGVFAVDLQNGNLFVYNNEATLDMELAGNKKLTLAYDQFTGLYNVLNDCDSDGHIRFALQGINYSVKPCESVEITLETETGAAGVNTGVGNDGENEPNEGAEEEVEPLILSPIGN